MTDWSAIGIDWVEGVTHVQDGPHATDRRNIGTAQILRIVDLEKFLTIPEGRDVLLAIANGTSLPVTSRAVYRSLTKDGKRPVPVEQLREAVWARVRGQRASVAWTRKSVMLPNGVVWQYDLTDQKAEESFRAAFAASLIDLGVNPEKAKAMASKAVLK